MNIKPFELRIGNVIKRRSKPELLIVDIPLLTKIQRQPFLFKGVELTDDLIERLGFIRDSKYIFKLDDFAIWYYNNNNYTFLKWDNRDDEKDENDLKIYSYILKNMAYVHEAQNIYLELNRKQLTLQ